MEKVDAVVYRQVPLKNMHSVPQDSMHSVPKLCKSDCH